MMRTKEASAACGVSLRQLQWWDEQELLPARKLGRNRVYSRDDLRAIRVIKRLREKGISIQRIRRILRFRPQKFHYIVTTGDDSKFFVKKSEAIASALRTNGMVAIVRA